MDRKIPIHVAIIPDGNRRWAKEKGFEGTKGHEVSTGKDRTIALFEEARKLGVKYVSIWGFSTENWNRSDMEKRFLFKLIKDWMEGLRDYAHDSKIRFRHLGRKDRLPKPLVDAIVKFERETEKYSDFNFQLCLDYGGRDEIVRAMQKIIREGGKEPGEEEFFKYLDTKEIPDPDMVIRTGGEKRLSGFMSFQSAYAELYFTEVYFPDFGPAELRKAVEEFSRRARRFGGD
ncbi:di-trans,poly-cis-decaprenylcistransferase [Candidatus Pacearchaeota archaeon]|nr:di-trans,poly-cis-decaprenylcistransferase [Candidatus Pacearchaeota archaeon]